MTWESSGMVYRPSMISDYPGWEMSERGFFLKGKVEDGEGRVLRPSRQDLKGRTG